MPLRLILVLLLALFAAPAMASACHDDAPPLKVAHAMHHAPAGEHQNHGQRNHRNDQATIHACIGCIPPSSWQVASIAPARIVPPLPRRIAMEAFVAGLTGPPALPPPRLG